MKTLPTLLLASSALLMSNAAMAESPLKVVATIKPVYSLLSSITAGTNAEITLLVKGSGSPHTYAMTPTDATALQDADVIFWVGPTLEHFIEKPLAALGGDAEIVTLDKAPGVIVREERGSGTFEEESDDAHGHDHDDHDHEEEDAHIDPHMWLDPINAKAFANDIASTLAASDPSNAAAFGQNAAKLNARLDDLVTGVNEQISQFTPKPYIVFHDAYQYYGNRFHVDAAGSITVNPEAPPSAQRIREIHEKLKSLGTACVFSEPQFPPKVISAVIEGTDTYVGTLDPLGAGLKDGPDLYFELLNNLTDNLTTCFVAK